MIKQKRQTHRLCVTVDFKNDTKGGAKGGARRRVFPKSEECECERGGKERERRQDGIPLVAGSGEVERAENDLPGEVDGVPQFWIVKTESDQVLPELLDVSCMSGEGLQTRA